MPPLDPKQGTQTFFGQGRVQPARAPNTPTEMDHLFDRILELQSRSFDKVVTYNNVVLTLGYAGFFAIWNHFRGELHPWDSKALAALLGVSLLLFIFWIVLGSFRFSRQGIRMAKILNQSDVSVSERMRQLDDLGRVTAKSDMVYIASWYFVFTISLLSGFAAGLILLALVILNVAGIEFSAHGLLF
jgi:hypothetical protein